MAIYQFLDDRVVTIALSQGFLDLFGYQDRRDTYDLMDHNMYRDTHPDDMARIADEAIRFAKEDGEYNVVYRTLRNGEWRIVHAFGKHICPEEGVRLAEVWYVDEGAYQERNDLVQEESLTQNFSISLHKASLDRKTNYDYLTGLPNMTYFFELSRAARDRYVAEGKECALCFANLNGMKYYNKKYGFTQGDKLLRCFSELLAKYFGNEQSGRIAQDNFAFFSPTDQLEKKLESLFMEFEVMSGKKGTTVRVGIYPSSMGVVDTSLACDRARYACNSIKDTNESRIAYFSESMLEFETNRQYVMDNLDRALEEGWIQAFYQPIVRAASGRVSDEEALARWIDPEKGMLSPAEFIPILEDAKLIYKVDLHMVDQILKKMKDQSMAGLYVVPISVNLSRTDFDACDIVNEIRDKVDAAGIGRDKLTIEITESVMGSDFEFMKSQVERFQKLGFRVWMDDFGSGYSSLDVLQNLKFDLIKLDMHFMRQFGQDDRSRIIITELIKMALSLGIETVCEGVERQDQVEFLSEIGCTKLQGFYYCKPIPLEKIIERNQLGIQIGFENPDELAYYTSVGRINLYDASIAAREDSSMANTYFDSLPMAIVGVKGEDITMLRCNKAYREFMGKAFGSLTMGVPLHLPEFRDQPGIAFGRALMQCAKEGGKVFVDERIGPDTTVHSLVRKIARNPVTDVVACDVVVLGFIQDNGQGISYADIASSLSADYMYLYHVNMETNSFVEYKPDPKNEDLVAERHGSDFFAASRRDAQIALHKDDSERFIASFHKDAIVKAIKDHGAFTYTYRLMVNDAPVYVHMKAVPMSKDPKYIIIGVSNIDAQIRAQETLERLQEEKITYARITALSGDIICIYTVDPETEVYTQYSNRGGYEELEQARSGESFFETARNESSRMVIPEDLEYFRKNFTRENVMKDIRENGVYVLNYRVSTGARPFFVSLKAVILEEKDGPQMIVGIINIDAQVKRDLEYERLIRSETETKD